MAKIDQSSLNEVRRSLLVEAADVAPHEYPRLDSMPTGVMFDFVPRPVRKDVAECVYVPLLSKQRFESRDDYYRYHLLLGNWNALWEAAHVRHDFFATELPEQLSWLSKRRGENITLVPLEPSQRSYDAYSALYHIIPAKTLQRFDLPLLKMGIWPFWTDHREVVELLPRDFNIRLANAFSHHIWPYLTSGSGQSAFAVSDSIRLLAHNLDFWVPYADRLVQERLEAFGSRPPIRSRDEVAKRRRLRAQTPKGVQVVRPLTGGYVWEGEDDAGEATQRLVEIADRDGRLRAIIDAIRSNRVEEVFSPQWSYAREDFERKLYKKRAKVKVTFVELSDTVPVHAPTSEVHDAILWQDFLSLLSPREKRVVVCLRNGATRLGDVAAELGYANHSPVSKALAKIRMKARSFLVSAT